MKTNHTKDEQLLNRCCEKCERMAERHPDHQWCWDSNCPCHTKDEQKLEQEVVTFIEVDDVGIVVKKCNNKILLCISGSEEYVTDLTQLISSSIQPDEQSEVRGVEEVIQEIPERINNDPLWENWLRQRLAVFQPIKSNDDDEKIAFEFIEYRNDGYNGGKEGLRCDNCDSKYRGDSALRQLCPVCKARELITHLQERHEAEKRELVEKIFGRLEWQCKYSPLTLHSIQEFKKTIATKHGLSTKEN